MVYNKTFAEILQTIQIISAFTMVTSNNLIKNSFSWEIHINFYSRFLSLTKNSFKLPKKFSQISTLSNLKTSFWGRTLYFPVSTHFQLCVCFTKYLFSFIKTFSFSFMCVSFCFCFSSFKECVCVKENVFLLLLSEFFHHYEKGGLDLIALVVLKFFLQTDGFTVIGKTVWRFYLPTI